MENSLSTTQTGIPRRPRLLTIARPWKSPPTTSAPTGSPGVLRDAEKVSAKLCSVARSSTGRQDYDFLLPRETWAASVRAANSVPATKYMSGPKFQEEGAPRKCKPGTEVSKPELSFGNPFTRSID